MRPMIESLAAKLAARKFVVTGELTPPKGTDLTKLSRRLCEPAT